VVPVVYMEAAVAQKHISEVAMLRVQGPQELYALYGRVLVYSLQLTQVIYNKYNIGLKHGIDKIKTNRS
jgi:hypothetical protein